jgi:acyl-CoA thioesterase-1
MARTTRVVLVSVLLALALILAFRTWRPGTPPAARPTSGDRVIAFGDSLVEGRGATRGRDFVSLLSARLGVPIVNAGRSGDTTATALARLDRDVLGHNPRVVVVLLGGNDFLRRVPTDQVFDNLTRIAARIRERGAAVVLVGVGVGVFTDPYREAYERVARRTSSGLVPDVLDGLLGRADLMADAIHPNDRGHEIMADRVEPVLRQLLAR